MVTGTFVLSGSALWGWSTTIDLDAIDSLDALITEIKTKMICWIATIEETTGQADLYGLRHEANDFAFHFHGSTIDEIKGTNGVVYVCACGHS